MTIMQNIFTQYIDRHIGLLQTAASGELSRVILTVLIIFLVPVLLKLGAGSVWNRGRTMAQKRERYVFFRNIVIVVAFVAVVGIWATRIAGFAFSLAAVAGAILIVAKEALLNCLGFLAITATKPFTFGDYIGHGSTKGRVVDINAMFTTLVDNQEGNQITGSTVTIPNSLLLTSNIRNFTATGEYVVNMLTVSLLREVDILMHEQLILQAAEEVCLPWKGDAERHLQKMEHVTHVDLPSADCKVVLEFNSPESVFASLRYACKPNERVKIEQEILRKYIRLLNEKQKEVALS